MRRAGATLCTPPKGGAVPRRHLLGGDVLTGPRQRTLQLFLTLILGTGFVGGAAQSSKAARRGWAYSKKYSSSVKRARTTYPKQRSFSSYRWTRSSPRGASYRSAR